MHDIYFKWPYEVWHYFWLSGFSLKFDFAEDVKDRTKPELGRLVPIVACNTTRD